MTIKGIDVSHWQGTIDWNKVKKAGIEFAIIKAGGSDAGFYTDSKWEANYKGAKAAGIPIGAYYFVGYKMSSRNVQKILNKNVQFNSSRIILDNVLQAV